MTSAERPGAARPAPSITVVLADDHPALRAGTKDILQSQPDIEVVAEAGDGRQAAQFVASYRPDVVLLDLQMPGTDGYHAARRISSESPKTAIVVFSQFSDDAAVKRALDAGAGGYLLKEAGTDEIIRAVRDAAKGDTPLTPAAASALLRRLHRSDHTTLSERELQCLRLVQRGLTNKEIAAELFIGRHTVKSYLDRIFFKLGVRSRAAAVATAFERGDLNPNQDG